MSLPDSQPRLTGVRHERSGQNTYFTNLDFPEIAGVPFPFQKAIFLGPRSREVAIIEAFPPK